MAKEFKSKSGTIYRVNDDGTISQRTSSGNYEIASNVKLGNDGNIVYKYNNKLIDAEPYTPSGIGATSSFDNINTNNNIIQNKSSQQVSPFDNADYTNQLNNPYANNFDMQFGDNVMDYNTSGLSPKVNVMRRPTGGGSDSNINTQSLGTQSTNAQNAQNTQSSLTPGTYNMIGDKQYTYKVNDDGTVQASTDGSNWFNVNNEAIGILQTAQSTGGLTPIQSTGGASQQLTRQDEFDAVAMDLGNLDDFTAKGFDEPTLPTLPSSKATSSPYTYKGVNFDNSANKVGKTLDAYENAAQPNKTMSSLETPFQRFTGNIKDTFKGQGYGFSPEIGASTLMTRQDNTSGNKQIYDATQQLWTPLDDANLKKKQTNTINSLNYNTGTGDVGTMSGDVTEQDLSGNVILAGKYNDTSDMMESNEVQSQFPGGANSFPEAVELEYLTEMYRQSGMDFRKAYAKAKQDLTTKLNLQRTNNLYNAQEGANK